MSDLLPVNATPQERALAETIARISTVPVPPRLMWDPDTCPADILPWLAWAFSVDEWDSAWSETQKRQAIQRSVLVHRYKGTIGAVREAVAALNVNCVIQEWFAQDPPGAPYTFRLILDADQDPIPESILDKLLAVVESTKNLRSHIDAVVPGATTEALLFMAGSAIVGSEVSVDFAGNLISNGIAISDGHYKSNALKLD